MRRRTGSILTGGLAALLALGSPATGSPAPGSNEPRLVDSATASVAAAADAGETLYEELPLVVPAVVAGETALDDAAAAQGGSEDAVLAADLAPAADRVVTDPVPVDGFQTLGVTWPEGADAGSLAPRVRVQEDGDWSAWRDVPLEDTAPDAGSADAAAADLRAGSESVWVGDSADAVQLSFAATPEGGPDDMSLVLVGSPLVDPPAASTKSSGALEAAVAAAAPAPTVVSRAAWGARPQVCAPDVASRLVGAVLHHTAGSNSYATQAEAMQQIRNDQAYHIDGRGWCDLGYNFVVDKWGTIYEGRANSGTQPVIGVHAGGFNTGTVGISMLGSYGSVTPSAATQEAVAQVVAWRLGQYHRDPGGTLTYRTLGGENSKFPAGTDVTLPVLFSHRDVGNTACPGEAGYQTLGGIRARARALIGTTFVNPTTSVTTLTPDTPVVLRAATRGNINWRLEVRHAVSGTLLASSIGYAQEAFGGVVASWDGRGPDGRYVGVGSYTLTLTGSDATTGASVLPFTTSVTAARDPNAPVVDPVPLVGDLTFVPVTPSRLLDTRASGVPLGARSRLDLVVTGVSGVPADAKAVALNVTTVDTTAVDFLRVYPAGQPAPSASTLNTDASRTTNAGTIVGVGGEGKVSIYNNAGTTHVVVDVTGYFTDASGVGDGYSQLTTAARVLDTRSDGGRVGAGRNRTVQVTGRLGIPSGATAVLANVSSVMPAGPGNINAFPSGGAVPTAASVNHLPGNNVSNRTIIPLSAGGALDLAVQGAAADIVIDVVGWFGPAGSLRLTPIAPARAVDTRITGDRLSAGQTRTYSVAGVGLPSSARVAMLSLAATQQTARATFLTAFGATGARPTASDLNTGWGRDQANGTAVGIGSDGAFRIYNDAGTTEVVVDVLAYFD